MIKRKLTICKCDECSYFDNEYFGYNEKCRKLNKIIQGKSTNNHPIPDDCPLEKEEDNS